MLNVTGRLLAGLLLSIGAPAFSAAPAHSPTGSKNVAQAPRAAKGNTEHVPLLVKGSGATNPTDTNTDQKSNPEASGAPWWEDPTWWLVIVTAVLAFFTFCLWWITVGLAREAKRTSERQAEEMKQTIIQSARSADAMENVVMTAERNAELMALHWERQMRAYISVDHGGATYQDENLKFAGQAVLNNVGLTPARDVCFSVNAAILDISQTENLKLPPIGEMTVNDVGIAPRQPIVLQGVVENRVSDAEAAEIMQGQNHRLFVWGKVTYKDIFGKQWQTNFCHSYIFFPGQDGGPIQVRSFYCPQHNNAM